MLSSWLLNVKQEKNAPVDESFLVKTGIATNIVDEINQKSEVYHDFFFSHSPFSFVLRVIRFFCFFVRTHAKLLRCIWDYAPYINQWDQKCDFFCFQNRTQKNSPRWN